MSDTDCPLCAKADAVATAALEILKENFRREERRRCAEIVREHKDTKGGANLSLQLPFNACIEEIAKAIEADDE